MTVALGMSFRAVMAPAMPWLISGVVGTRMLRRILVGSAETTWENVLGGWLSEVWI